MNDSQEVFIWQNGQLLDKFAPSSSGTTHLGSAKGKTVRLCGNT